MRKRRARLQQEVTELNITAFMNLMVILVPFLLITAVFSRLAILELNLPGASTEPASDKEQTLQLEVTVRKNRIEVADRNVGLLGAYENTEDGHDLKALAEKLQDVKARYPEKLDVTLLLEADIAYDTLVQVMDKVRVAEQMLDGELTKGELFPEISIGDAVIVEEGA